MCAGGWIEGEPADYRPELGLDTRQLFTFIGASQPDEWEELVTYYGGDRNEAQRGFAKRLDKAIADDGLLDVLRKGVRDHGVRIRLAYFRPSFVESDAILDDYRSNRLTVVRELAYATKQADRGNRLDLTLFLNGIPVATAELKNPLTGSGVEHAKAQYRSDRDPTELIFARRVLANFAVDPDLVFVSTALRGAKTHFLPFNTGSAYPKSVDLPALSPVARGQAVDRARRPARRRPQLPGDGLRRLRQVDTIAWLAQPRRTAARHRRQLRTDRRARRQDRREVRRQVRAARPGAVPGNGKLARSSQSPCAPSHPGRLPAAQLHGNPGQPTATVGRRPLGWPDAPGFGDAP
ncbi:type I restriction endonuclease [Solwaraspora sp. WMMB335]|uniref:type I restriction endonuclease n=1 Tax=Solwaraspora sp. WMMB335 TaxID=3404118 RepID=UPI003B932F07